MSERSRAMGLSVLRVAASDGLAPDDIELLRIAHEVAMRPRLEQLDDDHHPAYLHPGRTALILLRDVGGVPAQVLAAAMLHESEEADLRVAGDSVPDALREGGVPAGAADAVARILESLPLAGDERLVERLVTLDDGALLAALAERLDQFRHAHMREDRDDAWRRALHEEAGSVWVQMSERAHPRLADRFRHWHHAIGRRQG